MQNPAVPTTERARLIMQTLLQMEKQFGKGSVLQLGSRSAQQVSVIPTGSISLAVYGRCVDQLGALGSQARGDDLCCCPTHRRLASA